MSPRGFAACAAAFFIGHIAFNSRMSGQGVEITREGRSIALTYTKPFTSAVAVEQTLDLLLWRAANAADEVIAQDAFGQMVRSTVATGATSGLFFRLRIDNAWRVSLAWNPSPGPEVAGYRLHYGTSSGSYTKHLDIGNVTKSAVSLPLSSRICYFAVTAYNSIGIESLPSKELKVRLQNSTARAIRAKPSN
ncbi:MAG: fibronectin type domain protein [Spartobacteria bacterium]|nr:fibronectin type domain protein [Spartobacteria bacterium]